MLRLLLLFTLLPALELVLLIQLGTRIGTLPTVALIFVTGVIGAALARHQGLDTLRKLQQETAAGQLPAGTLVDAAIILVAGALLVTPGVLTDLFGFLCLTPPFRRLLRRSIRRRLERAVREGHVKVRMTSSFHQERREEKVVRDVREQPPPPRQLD